MPNSSLGTHCEIAFSWMPQDFTDKSTLVQVMAWCLIYASVNWIITGSGNGLSPVRRQAITRTNIGLLSIGLLGTNFSEIWIGILSFSFKNNYLKMSSVKMAAILSRERWVKKRKLLNNIPPSTCTQRYNHRHHTALHTNGYTHCGLMTPYGDMTGSTLAHLIACCLMVQRHYLNRWWLIS